MQNNSEVDLRDGILEVDCVDTNFLGSTLDKKFKEKYSNYIFRRLIVRTKYYSKQYDENLKLLSVEPFFMDVTFLTPYKKLTLIDTYKSHGAIINILDSEEILEKIYQLNISDLNLPLSMLKYLFDKALEYEETGKSSDNLIRRWYQEFGVLEYLMKDSEVLEININPPSYETPMRIIHSRFGECVTNIFPSQKFLDYFITRLKMKSGRPLNKVNPELDTEIDVDGIKGRIAGVVAPFSIFGEGFSIRKHREKPWTLELFVRNKTLNLDFVSFMNLIISHGRSYIVAGPRGSGKTSIMTATLLEIPTNNRLITIEDTQEIPIQSFKNLGYDLLPLKVRSALMDEGMEVDFVKGLRTTLRLGDSCLILGEIRGKEAVVLYEAMRVGAMSNVVSGTIHADTAYGVYDRVVNDLGVTKGSFKVTDIIILVNLIKDLSGAEKKRRIVEVVEVLKDWEDEPKFQSLFVYDPKTDELKATDILLKGKSLLLNEFLKNSNVYKTYDDVLKDMFIRRRAKEIILNNIQDNKQLEAEFTKKLFTNFLKKYSKIKSFSDQKKIDDIFVSFEKEVKEVLNDRNL